VANFNFIVLIFFCINEKIRLFTSKSSRAFLFELDTDDVRFVFVAGDEKSKRFLKYIYHRFSRISSDEGTSPDDTLRLG